MAPAQQTEITIQKNAGGKCVDMAISDDGLLLAKINDEGLTCSEVEIWNTKTGHLVRTIQTAGNKNVSDAMNNKLVHIRFWKGSKNIVTGTLNGVHEVFSTETGKKINTIPLQSFTEGIFAVSKQGTFVALHGLSFARNQLMLMDLYSNTLYDSARLELGSISAMEFSPDGTKLAIGTEDGSFHIIELKTWNRVAKVMNAFTTPVHYLQWTNDNYLLAVSSNASQLWNMKSNTLVSKTELLPDEALVSSPTEDCLFKATADAIIKKGGNGQLQKAIGIKTEPVYHLGLNSKESKLFLHTEHSLKTWDLNNLAWLAESPALALPSISKTLRFLPYENAAIYTMDGNLIKQTLEEGKDNTTLLVKNVQSFAFSSTSQLLASTNDSLIVWQGINRQSISTAKPVTVLSADAASQKVLVVLKKEDSTVQLINTNTQTTKQIALQGNIACGTFSQQQQLFAAGGNNLYIIDASGSVQRLYDKAKEDWSMMYNGSGGSMVMSGYYDKLCFIDQGRKLAASSRIMGLVKIWNIKTAKIESILQIKVNDMTVSEDGLTLFMAIDNQVLLMDASTLVIKARMAFQDKGDYIVVTPDNHYKASRKGALAAAFAKGNNTYGFDQFDAVYNRPDIVMESIGKPAPLLLENVKKAVGKRMKKLNMPMDAKPSSTLDAPEISITAISKIPSVTTEVWLKFGVFAKSKIPITKIFGYINGIPINSSKGFAVHKDAKAVSAKGFDVNFDIALDAGHNLVEVSCLNERGIESSRETFEIFYEDEKPKKPDLYFIGIGAGNYADKNYNLKYPPKDIADVTKLWQAKKNQYGNIYTTTLLNEQVTKQEIKKLYTQLLKTKIDDEVIIYWSGHGLVGKDLDYYLATYDADFANPEAKALPYDILESLLDSISARKKLLIIDACHSGEIDKEDVVTSKLPPGQKLSVKGVTIVRSKNNSVKTVAALTNELFTDVRRSTGANIISAAGGAEFAIEGDAWNNGVFTYCLINGLRDKKADLNNNGQITISELQAYLQKMVPSLTQGRQKPTSRRENIIKDWIVW
jgi:WD40 repeat protein